MSKRGEMTRVGAELRKQMLGLHMETMKLLRRVLIAEGEQEQDADDLLEGAGLGEIWRGAFERLVKRTPPSRIPEATPQDLRDFRDAMMRHLAVREAGAARLP